MSLRTSVTMDVIPSEVSYSIDSHFTVFKLIPPLCDRAVSKSLDLKVFPDKSYRIQLSNSPVSLLWFEKWLLQCPFASLYLYVPVHTFQKRAEVKIFTSFLAQKWKKSAKALKSCVTWVQSNFLNSNIHIQVIKKP